MKKIVSMLLALVMLFGTAVSFISCDKADDEGAYISVYLGDEIYDFDPTDYYADSNAEQVMSLLYEPLFSVNAAGELKCAAAKEYNINKDKRTITITIRETYWSNNVRVKAEDYVYAWRSVLLDPTIANPAATLLYSIENAAEIKAGLDPSIYNLGLEISGLYEIKITYREGADYKQLLRNLASVATSPLPQDLISDTPDYWGKNISGDIVTNGPFKIAESDNEEGFFSLSRNKGYHKKPSSNDNTVTPSNLVTFKSEEEDVVLTYSDVVNKTVFYLGSAPLEDRYANADKAKVTDDLSTYTYVFNTTKAPFDNANIRRALSLALDRETIAEAVAFGKAANGLLPDALAKNIYGTIVDRISSKPDYDAARELIEAEDIPSAQKKFSITVNDDEESVAVASIAKEAWEALGFTVSINKVSKVTSVIDEDLSVTDSAIQTLVKKASYGEYEFDVLGVDWQFYSDDAFAALAAFTTNMSGNGVDFDENGVPENRPSITGWNNASYDDIMKYAYEAETDEQRDTALKNAEKRLLDSCFVIPVLYNQNYAFISADLTDVKTDGFGNFIFTGANLKGYQKYLPKDDVALPEEGEE